MPIGTFATGSRTIGEATGSILGGPTPITLAATGVSDEAVGQPNVVGAPQSLAVTAVASAAAYGRPNVVEPLLVTAAMAVDVSAGGVLGIAMFIDGTAGFQVNVTGTIGKPPLSTKAKVKVSLRGMLHVPPLIIPPPPNVLVPMVKRVSLIMPTPVLDANGVPQ